MKKILLLLIVMLTFLSGCKDGEIIPPRTEINNLMFVRVLGIDKGPQDNITVTGSAQSNDVSSGSAAGAPAPPKPIILKSNNKSAFSAVRDFQKYTDKRMFFGHTSYYLIGEDAAKDNLGKYIDFLARDHEIRLASNILITYGDSGKLIEESSSSEFYLSDHLEALSSDEYYTSDSKPMNLIDLMESLEDDYPCVAIPALSFTSLKPEVSTEKKDIQINGYAIVKDLKLIGFLKQPIARGYNYLINYFKAGSIDVKDKGNNNVGLEVLGINTKVIPIIEENKIVSITYHTQIESNIDEVDSNLNVFKESDFLYIQDQQSKIIKDEMEKVVAYAKENKADFINAYKSISQKYPLKADSFLKDWSNTFSNVPIKVEVESHIKRTYDYKEPLGYEEGGKK